MGINSRWMNVHDEAGQVVAQWLLDNPYTGPATAFHLTDEWVHYPNGALKIRYLVKNDASSTENPTVRFWLSRLDPYAKAYRVRYTVPAEVFKSAEATQQYVAERVTEFIQNRDSYEIDPAQGYHVGK